MRILKSGLVYVILLLSVTAAHAQVSIGVKGGLDFGKITNAIEGNDGSGGIAKQSTGTVTQWYGEVFADIPLDTLKMHMFYIRAGVEYLGAGGEMDWTGDYYIANGFTANTKYKLHYVDVPVEFMFSPNFSWGRPYVGLGLYTGALMNGTVKNDSVSRNIKIGSNATDDFQKIDFGYTFSIGLVTQPGFTFGIDYQHGLIRTIPNGAELPGQAKLKTHNSVWGLNIGWIFKL
jgi:Outer membrane protein beta-barrel domain